MTRRWDWTVTPSAKRDLRRPDPPVRLRITKALDRLAAGSRPGDIKRLAPGIWRLRVGAWRITFKRNPQRGLIEVLRILPRGRAYRR